MYKLSKWSSERVDSEEKGLNYISAFVGAGANAPVEMSYVLNSHAITIRKNGKLVGGEILNYGTSRYRYFEMFKSDAEKKAILLNENLDENSLIEISGIFHTKGLSLADKIVLFVILYYKAWQVAKDNNKTIILGGSFIQKVQIDQMRVLKHLLLSMPISESFVTHGSTSGVAKVYYCYRKHFLKYVSIKLVVDVLSGVFKSIFKKRSYAKPSGKLVIQR